MNYADCRNANRRGHSLIAALALTIAVFSSPENALLLNHSGGFNTTSELRGSDPRLEFVALLPLFDPTLGTLRFEGRRFFDRFNFTNLVASTAFDEVLDVPAGTESTFGSITLTLPGRASAEVDVQSRFSRTSRPLQIRNIVLREQGDVSPFIGVGNKVLEFSIFLNSPLALPNSGSIFSGVSSSTSWQLDGSVDVTYDYLAAPVAARPVMILALAGLAAVGLGRRRSTRSAV
jgi:hypothetical protein